MTTAETRARILLEQALTHCSPELASQVRSAVLAAMDEGKGKPQKRECALHDWVYNEKSGYVCNRCGIRESKLINEGKA